MSINNTNTARLAAPRRTRIDQGVATIRWAAKNVANNASPDAERKELCLGKSESALDAINDLLTERGSTSDDLPTIDRVRAVLDQRDAARWEGFDLVDLREALNMTDPRIPESRVLEAAAQRITSTPPVHSAGVQEAIRSLLDEMDECAEAGGAASTLVIAALRALVGVPK
jgi:hypothetical protein